MEKDKVGNVFISCPKCHHINISDTEFYRVRCSQCGEIFINLQCTLNLE